MSIKLIERDILKNIEEKLSRDKIIVLLGARQTGKTSLLKLIFEKLPDDRKVYIDLDLISNRSLFDTELELLYFLKSKGYDEKDNEFFYLIVDEFQNVENSTIILKSIYDNYKNIKIIASGSSSLGIRKKVSETMAGRTIVISVNPLTFEEFLFFRGRDDLKKVLSSDYINKKSLMEIKQYFYDFIVYGGYPEVALTNKSERKIEILNSIFEFYIEKDIRNFMNVRNIKNFNRLMEYIALMSGGLLKYNHLANDLGINIKTVRDYVAIVEDTFLIKLVSPYSFNLINSIKKASKLYFIDTGLRNYLLKNFNQKIELRADMGVLYETFVFSEIYKRLKINENIFFFRTKQGSEIDFVLKKDDSLTLLEVKRKVSTIPKIFANFPELKKFVIGEEVIKRKKIDNFLLIYNFYEKLYNNV